MGLEPGDVERVLLSLLDALGEWLTAGEEEILGAWRARDALRGHEVRWAGGTGRAAGVDDDGRLLVELASGGTTALDAGEVHLLR